MHVTVETKRFDATPPEWLKLGGQCGELTNKWAKRDDIVAFVGKGAGMGIAAALWNPILAEMELNVEQAFGEEAKPQFIGDLTDRDVQFEHPVAAGAIFHEAMHARHTKIDMGDIRRCKDKRVSMLAEVFEEIRIEHAGTLDWPKNRSFLRACALKLVCADIAESGAQAEALGDALNLSHLMVLTRGRIMAGVLEEEDIEPITKACHTVFGADLTEKLDALCTRATKLPDSEDWTPHRKLAEEWLKLLEDNGHKTQPTEEEKAAAEAAIAAAIGKAMEQLEEMAEDAEISARAEGIEQAAAEADEAEAKARAAQEREDKDAAQEAEEIFKSSGRGTTDYRGSTRSRLHEKRKPTSAERAAAVTLSRELDKARYRDRVVVRRNTAEPPGRLRARTAMQGAAMRSRGMVDTTTPWHSKRRFHVEDPELKLAMMTDISGSRGHAVESSAACNWIFSEAGRRIQAHVASVYYGNSVFPGLSPGQHLDQVEVYTAPDMTERFDQAFKALNGRLQLLNSSGARLLVVISDLHYTPDEQQAARKWFTRCSNDGVGVIILPFDRRGVSFESAITSGIPGVRVIDDAKDPVSAAMAIGRAACQALEAVGSRG
jgi:hypothetical protein